MQENFLRLVFPHLGAVDRFGEGELRYLCSRSADEINTFLREAGYTIALRPLDPKSFGVASIMDIAVSWLEAGTPRSLVCEHGNFPAVHLKGGVQTFDADGYEVAVVQTSNGDRVCMTRYDVRIDGLAVIERVKSLRQACVRQTEHDGVHFPMVEADREEDISWLLNMETTDQRGQRVFISQALQQTRFRMNEIGARAQSAAAIAVTRSMRLGPEPLRIDGPMLLWIERDGMPLPLFVGHFAPDSWKRPESLD